MDALSARLRATLENDARATVVSLDGRSAYDCISRAAFRAMYSSTRTRTVCTPFYAQTFEYQWWDDDGVRLPQAEGCEQGDPLVFLALFALGQQEALRPLRRADSQLRQGESLMAFLDGLYVLLPEPSRARAALDLVTREVETHAPTWARRVFSTTKVARRPAAMWLRRSGPPI